MKAQKNEAVLLCESLRPRAAEGPPILRVGESKKTLVPLCGMRVFVF